jgi:hypothetical protein
MAALAVAIARIRGKAKSTPSAFGTFPRYAGEGTSRLFLDLLHEAGCGKSSKPLLFLTL